jgi:hypothetical protein
VERIVIKDPTAIGALSDWGNLALVWLTIRLERVVGGQGMLTKLARLGDILLHCLPAIMVKDGGHGVSSPGSPSAVGSVSPLSPLSVTVYVLPPGEVMTSGSMGSHGINAGCPSIE